MIGRSQKSNKTAELLRHNALQLIKNGDYHDALLKLNRGLCHAELKSTTICYLFAHRADVYFQLKLYDKCLNNISLARESHTSLLSNDLDELEEKCLENIENQMKYDMPWDFFKLSYTANKKLPFIVDCLEVKNDEKYGRYIITTKDLYAGDILAIEEPFFKFLKKDPDDSEYPETNIYNYCTNCLNDNYFDLLPCEDCNSSMFCSTECMECANNSFHQYECNIADALLETGNFRMAIRSFFVSLSICNGDIKELKKIMQRSDEENPTVFSYNFNQKSCPNNLKNYLSCMISLAHKTDIIVGDFSHIFQSHSLLKNLWSTEKDFINQFLERMMQIEILNFHGIKGRSLCKKDIYRRCVGDGSFSFCSLLNHSCSPNIMRIVVDSKMVVVVERPIKAMEQLFDCYIGDSFYFKTRNLRQKELEDYNFICECLACSNEFPELTSGLLNVNNIETLRLVQKSYRELQDPRKNLTPTDAKLLAKKYTKLLNQIYSDENYPSREIITLQICIIKCFLTAARSTITFP